FSRTTGHTPRGKRSNFQSESRTRNDQGSPPPAVSGERSAEYIGGKAGSQTNLLHQILVKSADRSFARGGRPASNPSVGRGFRAPSQRGTRTHDDGGTRSHPGHSSRLRTEIVF